MERAGGCQGTGRSVFRPWAGAQPAQARSLCRRGLRISSLWAWWRRRARRGWITRSWSRLPVRAAWLSGSTESGRGRRGTRRAVRPLGSPAGQTRPALATACGLRVDSKILHESRDRKSPETIDAVGGFSGCGGLTWTAERRTVRPGSRGRRRTGRRSGARNPAGTAPASRAGPAPDRAWRGPRPAPGPPPPGATSGSCAPRRR